jgi:hypothetical protein
MLLALATLLAAWPAAAARIERTHASVQLPPGRSVLSPYVNPRDGALVLHVQPAQSAVAERLLDARTGQPWQGDLPGLLRDFSHLGSETIADVASGTAPDLALLRALGCTRSHILCTSIQDAEVLLLAAPAGRDTLALTVIDLRALLAQMDDLLAGRREGTEVDWGDAEWRVLEVVALQAERRTRWLDALRSIRGIDEFQRALASVSTRPRLGARSMFQGANPAVDLRSELELLGHKLLVGVHAGSVLAGGGAAAQGRLADALESATQPPNQIGVATHLVDLLGDRPAGERQRLATAVASEATRRRSEVLHCFAQWLDTRPCGEGAPPWVARDPAVAAAPKPTTPAAPGRPAPAPRDRVATPPAAATADAAPAATAQAAASGDAPHEWTLIQGVPNKLLLVAFNESSGRMVPDRAVVGGFSFVARALGPVQDGRFEVEVSSNPGAPVRLRHGQYRVRAKLVLDYTREDQCVQGMTCWFSRPELHAKSVPREVVFFMTVSSRFTDRRRTEFGTLLPLVADGNARYRSQLKEARLAIESVRFELL